MCDMRTVIVSLTFILLVSFAAAQAPAPPGAPARTPGAPASEGERDHQHDSLMKAVDDLMWHHKVGDIAEINKVRFTGPPPHYNPNPTGQGAGNPMIIPAYTFIPKKLDRSRKHALLVLVHGGVHANFSSSAANIVRELIEQGYPIIAPEYRGSTGYGGEFYRQIDYGGLENEDVFAARNWMLEQHDFLDPKRVGIMGWSHGGMITLMNIFAHPEGYAVAYAGVPVSDLVARMGYKSEGYRRIFSAPSHIGKTADANVAEYRRRSPVTQAAKLQTPLLIHTNTNDEDVNVLEVEHLIQALKAEGKKFEYKIYQNVPGGHAFNRLDTKVAKESRAEIYKFLAQYLKP
jgi:dipeptidyl aminopeptidase/acylaminoacyl peptidase